MYIGALTSSVDLAHMTALHHACMASASGCVEELLAQPGIQLDSQDVGGCTALLYCLKNNNRDLEKVYFLLLLCAICTLLLPLSPQLLVSHGASLTAALDSGFSDLCYHTIQDDHSA